MKRIYLLCGYLLAFLLLAQSAWAKKPWNVMDKAVEDTSFSSFAIDNLINKRPIRYAVSAAISDEESSIFAENIRTWPREVLRQIKEANRTEEFSDVLPYLKYFESESAIQQVTHDQEPDIYLEIDKTFNDEYTGKFKSREANSPAVITVNSEYRDDFKAISLHEIGHYFGLGDEYGPRKGAHPEYSSEVNTTEKSIMQVTELNIKQITCDDVDGFINLFDLRLAQRPGHHFSARAENGWKSLCPGSVNIYKKANTITRNGVAAFMQSMGRKGILLTSREYKEGKVISQTSAHLIEPLQIFSISPEDTVIRNPKTQEVIYVRTVVKGDVEIPQKGKKFSNDIIWEKEFTYLYPEDATYDPSVKISVKHLLNGVFVGKQEIELSPDGSLFGDFAGYLTPDTYKINVNFIEVRLTLNNKKIEKFSIIDEKTYVTLSGTPNKEVSVSKGLGARLEQYKLPLSAGAGKDARLLMDLYHLCYNNLISFYRNFYEPIFEQKNHEQIGQQAAEQIKKELNNRGLR